MLSVTWKYMKFASFAAAWRNQSINQDLLKRPFASGNMYWLGGLDFNMKLAIGFYGTNKGEFTLDF